MYISCIVVNFQSSGVVAELLQSYRQSRRLEISKVLIVDNGSNDGSANLLHKALQQLELSGCVQVIESGRNAGFGAGNNFGARQLQSESNPPDILWLLNPDTLVDETDLTHALQWFSIDPNVGIVGTAMVDGTGNPDLAGHRDHSPIGEFVSNAGAFGVFRKWAVSDLSLNQPGPVHWVSGASLLIRRSVFEHLGGFDEGFFLYFEEVDLCRRARQAGWKVIYEPRSRIVHLEGSSTGISRTKPMPKYWYESRRRYIVKHYGVRGLWASDIAWGLGRIVGMIRGRGPTACRWRDIWRCDLPVLLGLEKLILEHGRK